MEGKKLVVNGKLGANLTAIQMVSNLEKLIITNYDLSNSEIEYIKTFKVKILQLDNVFVPENISFNSYIEKLYLANINSNFSVNLTNLFNLSCLKIYQCENIYKLDLADLNNLEQLYINNSSVSVVTGIETLRKLNLVDLDGSNFKNSFILPKNNFFKMTLAKNYFLTRPKPWSNNV